MRIGHVTYRYKPIVGGMETYVGMLYEVFAQAGYSQRIYQVNTGIRGKEFRFVPRLPFMPKQIAFNIGLPFRLLDLAREDWLIINNAEHYLPVAWHPRTVVLSHGATWTADESPLRRRLRKLSAQIAFKGARRYVFNDTFAMRELGINCPPKKGMFQEVAPGKWFIPNCVDADIFRPNEGLESLKRLNPILVPRNLTYPRGVDLAIKAFAIFVKEYPQTNLVIVGDIIYDNMRQFRYKLLLTQLIEELDLVGKVYFLGNVARERMPQIYSSAMMTLIPTRRSEGTSLAALESMACGIATISTDVEGLLDLPTIQCSVDINDMATTMLQIYLIRERIGKEQQATVQQVHNLANWSRAWLRVLDL